MLLVNVSDKSGLMIAKRKLIVPAFTYRNLEDKLLAVVLRLKSVENGRNLGIIEFHCWVANALGEDCVPKRPAND
jgi:hypothetical protein